MKTPAVALAAVLVALPALAAAQNPVSDALRATEQRQARNLVAAADLFPADKYVYKPTEAQMSVGDIVVHLIEGNDQLCSGLGGTPAPRRAALAAGAPKDQLVARLRETFQSCETALAGVTDAKMNDQVPFFGGRQTTRATLLLATVADWADHYSQLAIYLRLNNILPPTARPRPGM